MLDAVADAMPRAAPTASGVRRSRGRTSSERLSERLRRYTEPRPELPQLVRISLRVEADEEELVAGSVRLVLQVHDEQNPLHLCDAAVLWTADEQEHGFGDRARTHAAIALRGAAEAWPVLDRLLELRVPDQITLDGDELESLLDARRRRPGRPGGRRALAAEPGPRADRERGAGPVPADVGARGPAPHRHLRRGRAVQLPLAARGARRPAHRRGDGPARPPAPRHCCGCAATGPSSTRRSPARPASGWSARPHRPRRSRRR